MHKLPEAIAQAIEAGRIPSPPQLLLRLLQVVDDDQSTMGDLASLVNQDPGLASRVLMIANSPALRRGAELRSVENCLIALGTRLVRSIATCLSIQNLFDRRSGISAADLSGFWAHSLMVAELSRNLAAATDHPHPDEAYLAGLLHDIGQLILLSALGEPYAQMLGDTPDEDRLIAVERERNGVHHGEIGTWLADQWQLDSSFADGILFHHASPDEIVTAGPLPQLVWLAHALASHDAIPPELPALLQQMFGTGHTIDLATLQRQAERQTRQIAEALGLRPPEKLTALHVWEKLVFKAPPATPEDEAEAELSAMIGGMAMLQPLQQDLFTLESEAEVLLALKESARILFELNRVAFVLLDAAGQTLSGESIGNQPAIFRQVRIPLVAERSLVAAAALGRRIVSSYETTAGAASLIDIQFARAFAADGLLCIPMISRQRATGVMVCGLSQSQYGRLARRLPWLLNFGRIAAISLETLQEAKSARLQAAQEASSQFTRQARRVIHEAGNPLGIIKTYLRILDRKLPEETGVRQELGILNEEIDRVASIVGRMSEIPQEHAASNGLDVGELVQELLLLYGDALFQAKGIQVETTPPTGPLRVVCERDSLKQILLNIWKNASEALSSGQRLRISLTDHVIHDGRTYIQLHNEDNGPGMSEAAMRAIHRPVEAAGTGSRGIGLSIVGTLASRQGIPITCRSQSGQGTSFSLLIPKYDSDASTSPPLRELAAARPDSSTGAVAP